MILPPTRPEAIRHDPHIFEPWILQPEIDARVAELAGHLALRYDGEKIRLLTVLNGALPFASLLRPPAWPESRPPQHHFFGHGVRQKLRGH